MPDSGIPALDVLIGMAFLFFLLATVVASVNEVIQTALNARSKMLAQGIRTLLGDKAAADKFFAEWRIQRLTKPAGRVRSIAQKLPLVHVRRHPSYIPARAFALTVLDMSERPAGKVGTEVVAEAKATVANLGPAHLHRAASTLLAPAQRELDATRVELEHAFDEVMDRASGWYKRYVQWWVLALSLVVVVALNVNSFTVAERLWKDDTLRAAVVQQAQQRVGEEKPEAPASATPQAVAKQIDKIEELKLPIGWDKANTGGDVWGRLAGWLVTTAAIALGAPFWFDLLGKLAQLRGVGTREGTKKQDARRPEDRDDPSRPRPVGS